MVGCPLQATITSHLVRRLSFWQLAISGRRLSDGELARPTNKRGTGRLERGFLHHVSHISCSHYPCAPSPFSLSLSLSSPSRKWEENIGIQEMTCSLETRTPRPLHRPMSELFSCPERCRAKKLTVCEDAQRVTGGNDGHAEHIYFFYERRGDEGQGRRSIYKTTPFAISAGPLIVPHAQYASFPPCLLYNA